MDRLWAPWRLKYVASGKKSEGCLFCNKYMTKNPESDYVVKRSGLAFILLNIYPYNNGHLMIAPARHTADIEDLSSDERHELFSLLVEAKVLLKKVMNPDGFNIGINCGDIAGAGIAEHIHIHIVPRWKGDTNFMPVISDVRVISESLDDLYKRLKEAMS